MTSAERVPVSIPEFDPERGRPDLWPAGEQTGRRRLRRFVTRLIERYADDRNDPAREGTSALSPYLAIGAVSVRDCLRAAVGANGGRLDGENGPGVWISELIWREFYRHVLVGFPRVCMNRAFKPETESLPWREAPADFEAWRQGRTGVPIVDAAMRQLLETGWMHNRLRMVSAMFLTKHLLIDWRWGEKHFMRHLVDGDFASNNGGWQWSASTGTDAAPYFRVFNPYRQSERFDPDGQFIRQYVPELAGVTGRAVHDPSTLPEPERASLDYPEPIVEHEAGRQRSLAAWGQALLRAPASTPGRSPRT